MEDLSSFLDYLTLPVKVVDLLREQLLVLNIPAPAPIMQALAGLIFGGLAWYFLKQFKLAEGVSKIGSGVVVAAATVGVLSILVAWGDEIIVPRSEQLVGTLVWPAQSDVTVELRGAKSQAMAATREVDVNGVFVLNYQPAFSDPPHAIRVLASGCKPFSFSLGRSHLRGKEIQIPYSCDAL